MRAYTTLRNTSRYPDDEVQMIVDFARRYVEKVAGGVLKLGRTDVTNCAYAYRGRAWSGYAGRTLLRIGPENRYPVTARYARYKDALEYDVKDWREGLAMLAAHEFCHHARWQYPSKALGKTRKEMEFDCEYVASDAIDAFRLAWPAMEHKLNVVTQRDSVRMAAKAQREEQRHSPEARLAKLEDDERRWSRKLKLATTKLKQIARRKAATLRAIDKAA